MTSEEYAQRVRDMVLQAGARMLEKEDTPGASAACGLYELALGGAAAVRGKGREHESDEDTQSFEKAGAKTADWLTEAREELTDCAAWLTGAAQISRLGDTERERYFAFIIFHLALAIDAIDGWAIWERATLDMAHSFVRPEDQ